MDVGSGVLVGVIANLAVVYLIVQFIKLPFTLKYFLTLAGEDEEYEDDEEDDDDEEVEEELPPQKRHISVPSPIGQHWKKRKR